VHRMQGFHNVAACIGTKLRSLHQACFCHVAISRVMYSVGRLLQVASAGAQAVATLSPACS
jgi:hypothetical protein